jgi:hypothetical protein
MVRRMNSDGLCLSIVKLNGTLELRFTTDTSFGVQDVIPGTDFNETVETGEAREAASGQPIVSLGLEMFLEGVDGVLEVHFKGDKSSMLAFQYDGSGSDDQLRKMRISGPDFLEDWAISLGNFLGRMGPPDTQSTAVSAAQGSQTTLSSTRDVKVQTVTRRTRSPKTQSMVHLVRHASVQTQSTGMLCARVQPTVMTDSPIKERILFPLFVDLTEQDDPTWPPESMNQEHNSPESDETHTITNAVAAIFQTFNEARDPYRPKRQADPSADYRAYKHIFIEGYRNGDGKDEEGRLHVDPHHHILLWKSLDDYKGGAKLTLDRLNLPRCESFPLMRSQHAQLTSHRRSHAQPIEARPLLRRPPATALPEETGLHRLLHGLQW